MTRKSFKIGMTVPWGADGLQWSQGISQLERGLDIGMCLLTGHCPPGLQAGEKANWGPQCSSSPDSHREEGQPQIEPEVREEWWI